MTTPQLRTMQEILEEYQAITAKAAQHEWAVISATQKMLHDRLLQLFSQVEVAALSAEDQATLRELTQALVQVHHTLHEHVEEARYQAMEAAMSLNANKAAIAAYLGK